MYLMTLCSCTLLLGMKFVGSIEFEIWTIVCRKLKWRNYDVITYLISIKFTLNLQRAYVSDIQISVWSNIRELRYTAWKLTKNYEEKKDFEPLWPWPLTNFNRVRASVPSNCLEKTGSKSVHSFGWNIVHKQSLTHRQTHRQTELKI